MQHVFQISFLIFPNLVLKGTVHADLTVRGALFFLVSGLHFVKLDRKQHEEKHQNFHTFHRS